MSLASLRSEGGASLGDIGRGGAWQALGERNPPRSLAAGRTLLDVGPARPYGPRILRQALTTMEVETHEPGLVEITDQVVSWVATTGVADGLLTLFIRHTSASLLVQENADPDVCADLDTFLRRLVPEDPRLYRHTAEGDDDMPAHIRAALTATQLSIPLRSGRLRLGTWQGIYVFEHRRGRFRRSLDLHVVGE